MVDIIQALLQQPDYQKARKYWNNLKEHDIKKETEFAILTNIIHPEWAGVAVKEHKKL